MSPSHQLSTVGSSVARNLKRPYPSGSEPDSPLTGVSNSPSLPPTEQAWRYLTGMVPNQINLQKHQNQSAAAQQTQILPRFASPRPICQKIEESRSTTKLLQKQASRAPFIAPKHLPSDYQMQLILLEQQNKKRLMMKRQEQKDQSVGSPLSRTSETMHTNGAVSKTTNPPTWVVRTAPEDSQPSSTYIPPSENLEMVQVNQQRLFELFAQFLNEAGQKSNEVIDSQGIPDSLG
jgi:hypothetical protein